MDCFKDFLIYACTEFTINLTSIFLVKNFLQLFHSRLLDMSFLDSGRGADHRAGYHKLISNKREWNNCFIKYRTLDKNISNYSFYLLEFSAILRGNFP